MSKTNLYVDKTDHASIEELIEIFGAHQTYHEVAIRAALGLHNRPFLLYIDHLNRPQTSPLHDAFSFNIETDELVIFTDDPAALVDAILEMALFLRGFNTVMGVDDEWKVQVAIGAWRYVREALKTTLGLDTSLHNEWTVDLELETVERFDPISFNAMVFLAGRLDVDISFPPGTSGLVISAYERLTHIIEAIALNIGLGDAAQFNRRLNRALLWIEESIMPKDISPFDDLFGPDGFSDKFFEDSPED